MKITVEEAKQKRLELEKSIAGLLTKFREETGVTITDVHVRNDLIPLAGEPPKWLGVSVRVNIDL